jgi:beta-lactamase superfamily II metal-dependent hydrolase
VNIKILSKPVMVVATAGMVASGLGMYIWREEHRPPLLEVYIFSMKEGQSVFIRTPEDRRILIDGGGSSIVRLVSKYLPFYSRRIDDVVVTKTVGKNVSGLISILDRYKVGQVYLPAVTLEALELDSSKDAVYETFIKAIKEHRIPVQELSEGDSLDFSVNGFSSDYLGVARVTNLKVQSSILFPAAPANFSYSKASGPSLVLNISHGDNSILLAGDLSKKIQKYIASSSFSDGSEITDDNESVNIAGDDEERRLRFNRAVVFSNAASPSLLSYELMESFRPDALIYSKKVTYATPKFVMTNKTVKASRDSSDLISKDMRFNVQDTGIIKIVSDGKSLTIFREKQ